MRRSVLALSACLALTSCAVGTTEGPPPRSMAAARAGLRPEYRMFYDALTDYGDWILIEPFGYVFRPRLEFNDWEPYQYGFWAPTDAYGWVWISSEPYGWATYHYGRWFHDDFQGWVWQPGIEWAPAWVDWRMNDRYVGWAPLGPSGSTPPGGYLFAPLQSMGSTDLAATVRTQSQLGSSVADAQPLREVGEIDGVRVPLGPSLTKIEKATGQSLTRARIDNLLQSLPTRAPSTPSAPQTVAPEQTRKAAEDAAREARVMTSRKGKVPSRVPIVRPEVRSREGKPRLDSAPRDTVRRPGG